VISLPSAPLATTLPSAGTLAVGAVAALVAIAVLVAVMRRYDDAFALLAVFALPFRLPISTGGRTVNLLIPLYLVVAAGTLTYLLPRLLGRIRRSPDASDAAGSADGYSGPFGRLGGPPTRLGSWTTPCGVEWLLFAAVALYVLQTLYSGDRTKGAENIAFFYVPFGLLFLILRDVRWTRALLVRCLGVAVVLAVAFAGVGFVEYYRKALFLNPKVVQANQYDNYFRVNSVFFDPSIYGRFLALVMVAVTTAVLARGSAVLSRGSTALDGARRRDVLIGAAVLLWLLAGLVTSFSQSSIAALVLGLVVLGAWCWGVRRTVLASVIVLVVGGVFVLLAPSSLHFGLKGSGGSANNATNGRGNLISGGLELFANRPLEGYGSGSFETEYKLHSKASAESAVSASHTIPVTVAAEQGILGLALYVALLVVAFVVLFRGAGRSPPRIAIAACFAALVLHTWTYADFLEDPTTWLLLAIGVALARQDDRWPARGGVLTDDSVVGAGSPA
jgi:O-antigen ligase